MGVLPETRIGQLQWFEARMNGWIANATAIGLTTTQANSLKGLVNAARAAATEADSARATSRAATLNFYDAVSAMREPGRAFIATIKAFAEATNNPAVYVIAQVDPPSPPTPVPAPAVPSDFTGSVSPTGQVTLTWSAVPSGASSGVFFLVSRKRAGEGAFTFVGGTPARSFIDPAADVCAGTVQYRVQAQRGDLTSEWTTPLSFDLGGVGNGPGAAEIAGTVGTVASEGKLVA